MRGHRFRALLSPSSRRVGVATALALALGGGLLATPADALITAPPSAATVAGIVTVHEDVTPSGLSPASGCTTASNGNKPGATNFTVYKGTPTASSPLFRTNEVYPASTFTGPLAPGGHDFTWNTDRQPNGLYTFKTTTQNRNVTGSCALAAAVVQSNDYPVTLKNVGVIDSITGEGSSGTTASVTARLVSPLTGAPDVITGHEVTVMKTRCYNLLGLIVSCLGNTAIPVGGSAGGADGSNPQSVPAGRAATVLPSLTGITVYTNGVSGYAPGIGVGESVARPNRIILTTDVGGTMTPQIVDCKSVFNKVQLLVGIDPSITDSFDGFGGCVNKTGTGPLTIDSTVNEGHDAATLTFTIGSHSADGVIDRTTGLATAEVNTPDIGIGHVPVTVTSSDDGFLAPGTAVNDIDFKGGTKTSYTGDTEAYWNEPFTVSASVIGDPVPDPAEEGTVTFKLGSQVSAPVDVVDGVASTTLTAIDTPAPGQHVVATYSGTELYNPSSKSVVFTTKPRPTHIEYTGPAVGKYNDNATYTAKLTDTRLSDAPLAGQVVAFKLGDVGAVTAVTDADGVATKTVAITSKVGTYDLNTDFFGVARYAASHVSLPFVVDYQYKFTDTLLGDGGSAFLNPDTQQAGFRTKGGNQSPIRGRMYQLSLYLPTVLGYPDQPGLTYPALPQEWHILNLPRLTDLFGLVANPPTVTPPTVNPTVPELPELPTGDLPVTLPMMSSSNARTAGTNNSGQIVLPNLTGGSTGTPASTGGMTVGDLINSVARTGIPTSLSACELLSGSTCERRFVIAAAVRDVGPDIVGVFDVKTGLFASLVANWGTKNHVLASLGSCVDDLPLCIAVPTPPAGLPSLTPPTLPDPAGLLDAIANLAAGLQAIPGQISAPPAPPAPETPEVPVPMSSTATPSLLPGQGNSLATLVPTYWLG